MAAQGLPYGPMVFAGGRVIVGGEAAMSIAPKEPERRRGFFNYTDYKHEVVRLVRLGVTGAWRVTSHLSLLGELRSENWKAARPFALYVRVRPWPARSFDIQVGRIPPTFGAFARRGYGADNPLIGYPLAYQYLTSIRSDALPATADDLLGMRARGWRVRYPIGAATRAPGLPLVSAFRWDTGVQVRVGSQPVEVSAALTTGTLSSPRIRDDNAGKQVSARVAVRPVVGLIVGLSAARGAYLAREVTQALPPDLQDGHYIQRAIGVDAEYSRDYWLVRGEAILSAWRLPAIRAPRLDEPVRAFAISVEGRYKLIPGVYAAARVDHLGFSRVTGSMSRTTWEAPVSRIEAGGGYQVHRNVLAKIAYQHNWRDGGLVRSHGLVTGQLVAWF